MNPTLIQPRGIDFLRPIWNLITDRQYLYLSFNDVDVYYTKYINNHKHIVVNDEQSVDDAVQAGLTPGKMIFYQVVKSIFSR